MHLKIIFMVLILSSIYTVQSKLTGRHDSPSRMIGFLPVQERMVDTLMLKLKPNRVLCTTKALKLRIRQPMIKIMRRKNIGWHLQLVKTRTEKKLLSKRTFEFYKDDLHTPL